MPYVWDKDGQRYEEPEVLLAEQQKYYDQHVPRLLNNADVSRVDAHEFDFGGHGELINRGYAIACKCNELDIAICAEKAVTAGAAGDNWVGPVSIACRSCGEVLVLFDERQYGFDGEYGNNEWMDKPSAMNSLVITISEPDSLVISFHYTDEGFEFDRRVFAEGGQIDEPRPEDIYTWISFVKMRSDKSLVKILDFECA